jgi:hypothetical protein
LVVYDLDARRIVDFKLKMWAEPYVMLRAALYQDQMDEEKKNRFNSGLSTKVSFHDPNGPWGRKTVLLDSGLAPSTALLLFAVYDPRDTSILLTTANRDEIIRSRFETGEGLSVLGAEFGVSPQRVYQIVHGKRK